MITESSVMPASLRVGAVECLTPHRGVVNSAAQCLQHGDGAVTHVAVVLRRSGRAEPPAKLCEFLVHLRPARLGVRRHGLGIDGAELRLLLPIQLHLGRGEQLVEEVTPSLPRARAAVPQPVRLQCVEVPPRERETGAYPARGAQFPWAEIQSVSRAPCEGRAIRPRTGPRSGRIASRCGCPL